MNDREKIIEIRKILLHDIRHECHFCVNHDDCEDCNIFQNCWEPIAEIKDLIDIVDEVEKPEEGID